MSTPLINCSFKIVSVQSGCAYYKYAPLHKYKTIFISLKYIYNIYKKMEELKFFFMYSSIHCIIKEKQIRILICYVESSVATEYIYKGRLDSMSVLYR